MQKTKKGKKREKLFFLIGFLPNKFKWLKWYWTNMKITKFVYKKKTEISYENANFVLKNYWTDKLKRKRKVHKIFLALHYQIAIYLNY